MVLSFNIDKINPSGSSFNSSNPLNFLLRLSRGNINQSITSGNSLNILSLMSLTSATDTEALAINVTTNIFNLTSGILKLPYFPNIGSYKNAYCNYTIDIRLTGTISGNVNTPREFLLELQRSDNTIVERKIVIKVNDNNLSSKGVIFETYTSGELDPFILNGLKLNINNTSSQTINITSATILIKGRTY